MTDSGGVKKVSQTAGAVAVFAAFVSALFFLSREHYPTVHLLVELFCIIVSWCTFAIAWNARRLMQSNAFLMISISYMFASFFDLMHAMTYKGMDVAQGFGTNTAGQLSIAARYMQCLTYVLIPLGSRLRATGRNLVAFYSLWSAAILALIFFGLFPVCYTEGSGQTSFKIASEYIISAIFAVSAANLYLSRGFFDAKVFKYLMASVLLMVPAGIFMASYRDPFGAVNFLGHIFRLASFTCIYRAIIELGLRRPMDVLFRGLKDREIELYNLSITDSITGLFNARQMFYQLKAEIERSRRLGHRLCLVMIDIDNFKEVNDRHGHWQGDSVLVKTAMLVKGDTRKYDLVFRYGGDEFLIILPETGIAEGTGYAERIRTRLVEEVFQPEGATIKITASMGVVELREEEELDEFVKRVDRLMYKAKAKGKNMVVSDMTADAF